LLLSLQKSVWIYFLFISFLLEQKEEEEKWILCKATSL